MPILDSLSNIIQLGPASRYQSSSYPSQWDSKVPLLVRMIRTVHSDLWMFDEYPLTASAGKEYYAYTNSHGAVSVRVDGQLLGIKPDEFEIVQFAIVPSVQKQPL